MIWPTGIGLEQWGWTKKFSTSPDWTRIAQLTFIYSGAKLNLPFDIDLQDKN